MARTVAPGVTVEQRVMPLERVGCYVPGGRYPLPSSLLMTAIPAKVAGVASGRGVSAARAVVMAAALEAGCRGSFVLAARTRLRPWRTARHGAAGGQDCGPGQPLRGRGQGARRGRLRHRLLRRTDGDRRSLPSKGPAAWIAADLIAQAEHDPDARAVLITPSEALADRVAGHVEARMPADGPARASLRRTAA